MAHASGFCRSLQRRPSGPLLAFGTVPHKGLLNSGLSGIPRPLTVVWGEATDMSYSVSSMASLHLPEPQVKPSWHRGPRPRWIRRPIVSEAGCSAWKLSSANW